LAKMLLMGKMGCVAVAMKQTRGPPCSAEG
jgi:hypothetical protein